MRVIALISPVASRAIAPIVMSVKMSPVLADRLTFLTGEAAAERFEHVEHRDLRRGGGRSLHRQSGPERDPWATCR
jgi:hypothetical protein